MTKRRTFIAVLAAAGLMVALAAPVAAKGRPKPTEPGLVDVRMTLVGDEGLTTDCNDGDGINGLMVMERMSDGLYAATLPILGLYVQEVDSSRRHPEPGTTSTGFTGCHGGNLDGSEPRYGGLGITLDDAGAVTDLLWHFDYYLKEDVVGKKRTKLTVMEHFTLSGHDLQWDAGRSTASGWFEVSYHLEDRTTRESIGYVPVDGSPRYLSFTLTMTPHD